MARKHKAIFWNVINMIVILAITLISLGPVSTFSVFAQDTPPGTPGQDGDSVSPTPEENDNDELLDLLSPIPESQQPTFVLPVVSASKADQVTIAYNDGTGKARYLAPANGERALAQPSGLASSASPEEAARNFIAAYGDLFGVKNQSQELSVIRELVRDGQRSHVRFQQTYQGIPVFGGELIVNMDAAKSVLSMSGEVLPDVSLDIAPAIDAVDAQQTAIAATAKEQGVEPETLTASEPELWIYNPVLVEPWKGPTALTWRLEVTPVELGPIRQLVLVDAQRGSIALSYNQLDAAKNRLTYTANNTTSLPGTLVCNESNPNCTGGDSQAVAAHKYAGHSYDFYSTYHGRDSINNAGMALISTTHYNMGECNAYWSGSQMVYSHSCNLAVDDVVAHEITHGVTEYEAGLFYFYQSGAINESFSDIWGEFVDLTNGDGNDTAGVRWQMGEDSSIGALRSMSNPPAFGDPDRIGSANYYTDTLDNGGVHLNSGVGNKAAYLMTDGGTFNGYTVTGLGITKVAKIYYEVQTNMLTSGSDYYDLGLALNKACWNLIGAYGITASDCTQVSNTVQAVEMFSQPPYAGYNPDAQVCPAGAAPADVFNDTFESGFGNWTLGAISGTNAWVTNDPWGPNPHSGTKALYADDWYLNSNSFARMTNAVLIPANAYLHFYHYFDLESGWDGGVVEYSTNGTTWIEAGGMIDSGKNYNFTGPSRGYVSTRLNLSSLSGQNVRFRWRLYTDGSNYKVGWWLDDVRIYNCQTLGAFTKTSPAHVAINQSLSPTLSWAASTGATSYEYCYSSAAGPCTKWNSVGSNTSVTLSGLSPNYTYYWQVRAVKSGGKIEANDSNWYKFTTQSAPSCTFAPYTPPSTPTFVDVPASHWAWNWIERYYSAGLTTGCTWVPGGYCPGDMVTREQMAVFIMRAKNCGSYTPAPVTVPVFSDVPASHWAAGFIRDFANQGITTGCSWVPGGYCPGDLVTREQMAVFVIRATHGGTYSPPAVTAPVFTDVPSSHWAAAFIKQFYDEGITTGCAWVPGGYCPADLVTREQMAVFIGRAFGLP